MADTPENKPIDKRLADRYLKRGLLDERTHEKYLKSLPDLADKIAPVETAMSDEGGGEDEDEDAAPERGGSA